MQSDIIGELATRIVIPLFPLAASSPMMSLCTSSR
ncbi:hypothetical protein [Aeromonas caviae]